MPWGAVELEPEVLEWLEGLPTAQFATVAFSVDLLAERPAVGRAVDAPAGRQARELRLQLDRQSVRVSYWIPPGRRIVLLTVFVKRRQQEAREIARAKRAMDRCMAQEHTTD
jgi:hypothetical protein